MYIYIYIYTYVYIYIDTRKHTCNTGFGCGVWWTYPNLQIIFHKRATKYRLLLRKKTYKDKRSHESPPPCSTVKTHIYTSYEYMCIYTHMFTCRCIYVNTYIYIYIYIFIYIFMYTRIYIHIFIDTHIYTYIHTHIYTNIYIYIYIYIHIYIYIYMYIFTRIPHIHIQDLVAMCSRQVAGMTCIEYINMYLRVCTCEYAHIQDLVAEYS